MLQGPPERVWHQRRNAWRCIPHQRHFRVSLENPSGFRPLIIVLHGDNPARADVLQSSVSFISVAKAGEPSNGAGRRLIKAESRHAMTLYTRKKAPPSCIALRSPDVLTVRLVAIEILLISRT